MLFSHWLSWVALRNCHSHFYLWCYWCIPRQRNKEQIHCSTHQWLSTGPFISCSISESRFWPHVKWLPSDSMEWKPNQAKWSCGPSIINEVNFQFVKVWVPQTQTPHQKTVSLDGGPDLQFRERYRASLQTPHRTSRVFIRLRQISAVALIEVPSQRDQNVLAPANPTDLKS